MQFLKKLAAFCNIYFVPLFWILLLLTLIPVTIMLGHKKYLEMHGVPDGIVSMELARTDSVARDIVLQWSTDTINTKLYSTCSCDSDVYVYREKTGSNEKIVNRLKVAKADITADYFFIVLYVLFLLVIIFKLEAPENKWFLFFILLPVTAGVCDYFEDFGMMAYLSNPGHSPNNWLLHEPHYSIASFLKFTILVFLVFFYIPVRLYHQEILEWVSDYIQAKISQVWRYRVIILAITLFALPLWVSDQGQDLLVNINNSETGVCFFLLIIALAAFLNWWLAKLFFQDVFQKPIKILPCTEPPIADKDKLRVEKKASRFFGVLTFLLPAFAILQALDASKVSYLVDFFLPSIWLALCTAFFYIIIRRDVIENWYDRQSDQFKKTALLKLGIVILLLAVVLPVLFRLIKVSKDDYGEMSPEALTYLSLDLVLMAAAFIIFVSLRTRVIPVE
jgi:hypothetical protein